MSGKKRFLLRLDERLYAVLERWAADEFRSVNGQIEHLLAEAARRAGRAPKPNDAAGGTQTTGADTAGAGTAPAAPDEDSPAGAPPAGQQP